MPENQPQSPVRPNCERCRRPLQEFPHASFLIEGHGQDAYHGEVRALANGFADVYVFGYGDYHVKASRLTLSDAVEA